VLRDAAIEHARKLEEWKKQGLLFGPADTIPSRADVRDEIARLYEPEIPESPSTVIRCEPKLGQAGLTAKILLEDGSEHSKLVITTFGFAFVHALEQRFGKDHNDWEPVRVQVKNDDMVEIIVSRDSDKSPLFHVKQNEDGVVVQTIETKEETIDLLG
jgi:hypothetical protein